MTNVTFIGLGEIGGAIANVIRPNATIKAWDKDLSKLPPGSPSTMAEALVDASVVFLCVPSWVMRDVAEQIKPHISSTTIIVSLAKGLEQGSLKSMDVVLHEVLGGDHPVCVLGGPLLAEELDRGQPGIGVVGTTHARVREVLEPLFAGSRLRLEYVQDASTVAFAAVLKNIYAVALGIAEGLGWGWNGKGWLAARSLNEMKAIVKQTHGDTNVIATSAGAGDFLATSMSPDSRNRTTGFEIARTGECKTPSEGCRSVTTVLSLLEHDATTFPILDALNRILNQHESPATVFQDLLTSPDEA